MCLRNLLEMLLPELESRPRAPGPNIHPSPCIITGRSTGYTGRMYAEHMQML